MSTMRLTCCVCGCQIPYMPHAELIRKGLATVKGDGSRVIHCNAGRHTSDEILKMINATPVFQTGKDYRKYATD